MLALEHPLEVESKMICITKALYLGRLDRINEAILPSYLFSGSKFAENIDLQMD